MARTKKAKPSYIYAIIGISLVLFLLGTLGWLVLDGRTLTRAFKENVQVAVILHDNTRDEMLQKLSAILEQQPFVKETRVITKEEAAEEFFASGGEDFTELLDFNPLYSEILLNLDAKYVNEKSLLEIEAFIMQSNIVREVSYPTAVVTQMNDNFRKIGLILGVIALLLFVIVIILIDNTVRLAMFSNRFLIKTMQMVGATRWFITRPFDKRAIINGFISGIIAVIGLWAVIKFAENRLPDLKVLHEPASIVMLMASMVIVGILISLLSTHRSVLKYLKMRVDDLY
ncbi:MAG: cell division protein FtsX [Chitinophagales bacterium]|nr:permease-like cell division protein FtsX [Chitinophagaceae bacterium]MCB9063851.1 cell division protein FtsX [Chitinophagales bacterium]